MKSYYFDYNATTPMLSEVIEAMTPYLTEHFANPSSLHYLGKEQAKAIRVARQSVAQLLGVQDDSQIIFTSGGTESNNIAIRSALRGAPGKREIITSAVEHSSVNRLCSHLEKEGYRIHRIGVDSQGQLNMDELRKALSDQVAVASLMMANNETGIVMAHQEAGELIKQRNILYHVDAVQTVGKCCIDLSKLESIDYLSLSGHKFYGPKGVGALFVRKDVPYFPLIIGGAQERGRRAGTENVAGIVGLGEACRSLLHDWDSQIGHLKEIRDYFEEKILNHINGVAINGAQSKRIPNTSNLRFQGVDGEALLFLLDQRRICVSSGSACMSGAREPSHVLKAMSLSDDDANSSLRFSFGRFTQKADIDESVTLIAEAVTHLRNIALEEQHKH